VFGETPNTGVWTSLCRESNPNGIPAQSPGLAHGAYPGETVEKSNNPTGCPIANLPSKPPERRKFALLSQPETFVCGG
jgi:hypothetical protein